MDFVTLLDKTVFLTYSDPQRFTKYSRHLENVMQHA